MVMGEFFKFQDFLLGLSAFLAPEQKVCSTSWVNGKNKGKTFTSAAAERPLYDHMTGIHTIPEVVMFGIKYNITQTRIRFFFYTWMSLSPFNGCV